MNSKNIWIILNRILHKISWKYIEKNEWNYIGIDDDFQLTIAQEIIDKNFCVQNLYFVIDKTSSRLVERNNLAKLIKENISKNTIFICNEEFDTVIEFNKIGVYRIGYKNNEE